MIKPVNEHLLIEPVKHDNFIATETETYQEKGRVLDYDKGIDYPLEQGSVVLFDSWLAAKFPSETEGEYYWLVKWEHVRAVEDHD